MTRKILSIILVQLLFCGCTGVNTAQAKANADLLGSALTLVLEKNPKLLGEAVAFNTALKAYSGSTLTASDVNQILTTANVGTEFRVAFSQSIADEFNAYLNGKTPTSSNVSVFLGTVTDALTASINNYMALNSSLP